MGFGNPTFLQDNDQIKLDKLHIVWIPEYDRSYKESGDKELKETIKKIHRKYKNANTDFKHIVIGHGASHILQALIAVLQKPVYAKAPYFSRFPTFTKNVGQIWISEKMSKYSHITQPVQIVTYPNNPDNKKNLSTKCKTVIYDLSYNWPQYTEVTNLDADIMVFSLSKATGHSSTRIGWAIIKDEQLANDVEEWIENNTSGISIEAQESAKKILNSEINAPNNCSIMEYGKKILEDRWKLINKRKFPFKILNNSGMFAWCYGKPPTDIKYVKGSDCGMSDRYFRLNIGCSNKIFRKFLKYGRR